MTLGHRPRQSPASDPTRIAYERRRRAAWLDYLRSTREAAQLEYAGVESNAWELLQRRLRRNDELLASGR